MPIRGPLSHLDLTVTDLARSAPFYDRILGELGFRRFEGGGDPGWFQRYPGGGYWGIALRLAPPRTRARRHDRWLPGLHHVAFHAGSRSDVDRLYALLTEMGAEILDPPADYSGPAYSEGYYAVFFADPDGLKLEVGYEPRSNP
jgi:catechol 2,3-dioxygenase-like lactoylglutathione lyase family enzyme